MKTILVAVNSQFIHSCLAVWQLKAACTPECGEVLAQEYNINQLSGHVFAQLIKQMPDVLCFSCYIWNISYVLNLAQDIKKALPDCKIILGGPEVSFDAPDILKHNSFIDFILLGEGEESLPETLAALNSKNFPGSPAVVMRNADGSIKNGVYQFIEDFSKCPAPYTDEMLEQTKGKIIYYESTRGCPFSCSYCLSQIGHGVRRVPVEKVKNDIRLLEKKGVKLLKFVDRTFNFDRKRATQIWNFIKEETDEMRFHFEIGGDLLREEEIKVLKTMPSGKIQLEIGVQTTNPKTLESVCRKTDMQALENAVHQLIEQGNIHIHLDLIAGLPHEGYESFKNSFNSVIAMHPHNLQLGFLKLIKGSKIRTQADENECVYRSAPPYEVIKTKELTPSELLNLKDIEEMLERYYNSGRFNTSVAYLTKYFPSPFDLYEALAGYHEREGLLYRSSAVQAQYQTLYEFSAKLLEPDKLLNLLQALRFDYYSCAFTGKPPACFALAPKAEIHLIEKFEQNEGWEKMNIPAPSGPKERNARFCLEDFSSPDRIFPNESATVLFDFSAKDPVTGLVKRTFIPRSLL